MANTNIVCSMCGDIGFPDKLFRCIRCHSRIQHSYCTNYYDERAAGVCDWCLSEERSGLKHGFHSKKSPTPTGRDGTDDYKVKEIGDQQAEESRNRGKSSASSSKPAGRRYKLLKDVLC